MDFLLQSESSWSLTSNTAVATIGRRSRHASMFGPKKVPLVTVPDSFVPPVKTSTRPSRPLSEVFSGQSQTVSEKPLKSRPLSEVFTGKSQMSEWACTKEGYLMPFSAETEKNNSERYGKQYVNIEF